MRNRFLCTLHKQQKLHSQIIMIKSSQCEQNEWRKTKLKRALKLIWEMFRMSGSNSSFNAYIVNMKLKWYIHTPTKTMQFSYQEENWVHENNLALVHAFEHCESGRMCWSVYTTKHVIEVAISCLKAIIMIQPIWIWCTKPATLSEYRH